MSSHSTVNHSLHFAHPSPGVHTQHVESYWARVKWRFKSMKGVSSNQLPSYLDEFMWRERWGESKELAFRQIMAEIATQYPVWWIYWSTINTCTLPDFNHLLTSFTLISINSWWEETIEIVQVTFSIIWSIQPFHDIREDIIITWWRSLICTDTEIKAFAAQ